MRRHVLLGLALVVGCAVLLFLFRDEARDLFLKLRPGGKGPPAMLRALPFKRLELPEPKKKLLLASLQSHEIYLPDILFTPRGAPKGTYFRFSVVLSCSSPEEARKLKEMKPYLEALMVEAGAQFPFADLRTPDGVAIFKKRLLSALRAKLGSRVADLWLVEYQFQKIRSNP